MVAYRNPEGDRPYALVESEGREKPTDISLEKLVAFVKHTGAIRLRGFDFDVEEFGKFASALSPKSVFNESPNRSLLDSRSNIQSVNLGTDPFPLHPELSRQPWKPDICLFACLSAPESGGQTTFCDGVAIVESLPDDIVAALAKRRLLYIQRCAPAVLAYWLGSPTPDDAALAAPPAGCPYAFRRVSGQIIRVFTRPVLHKPMFTDQLAFGNFLLFARDYLEKPNFPCLDDGKPFPADILDIIRRESERLTVDVNWRPGEMLILDNSRFMHGRRRIIDPDNRKIASYFGYLDFAPVSADEPDNPIWRRTSFVPPGAHMVSQ